jgi:hypothetical protein
MKKMVFALSALMALSAGVAMAGTDLSWNDCQAGGGLQDRTVACTNTGSGVLYLSVNPDVSSPKVGGIDAFMDVVPGQPTISSTSWWNPATTGQRWGAPNATGLSGACPEWWALAPSGGIVLGPSAAIVDNTRLRLEVTTVIAAGEEQDLEPLNNYMAGGLILKNSAGTFGNAECNAGGAIGVYKCLIEQPGQPNDDQGQTPVTANCATFRNAFLDANHKCPGATPTNKASWGSIKALYR